jgi:3-oxoadipate enol-lactonase
VSTPTAALIRYHDVKSADGTRLRAWTNDADGPTVLVSNGLGTSAYAWPGLLRPDCGVHAIGWNHRGVGGSARPASGRVGLDTYVEDAIAVMDDAGLESAVVAGWSTGVTVAFELALRHPERVAGILAVAGVPGDSFATMLAPLKVPPLAAKPLMIGVARSAAFTGHLLGAVTRRIPWTTTAADVLRHTGVFHPAAHAADLRPLLQEFFTTDPAWYARLALAVAEHDRVSLSGVDVPTTFVAGRWDVFAGARHVRTAAERVAGSRYRALNATHFIPVEYPDLVLDELKLLLARA